MKILASPITLVALAVGAAAPSLAGAGGPQLQRTGDAPAGVELVAAYVYADSDDAKPGQPPLERFSSGVAELTLFVEMKAASPPRVDVDFDVFTKSGKVELTGGYASWAAIPAVGKYTGRLPVTPKDGKFADGAYQMKLLMDKKEVAILNWSVGEAK